MKADQNESESVVRIDELNLDKECIRLPSDYLRYAHLSADLKQTVSLRKAELDVVEADLCKKIRTDPQAYGIEKVTESAIKECVATRKEYKQAVRASIEAQHDQDIAQAVVWALEHKKRSLTLLVELHGLGYTSTVKLSDHGRKAVEKMTKEKVRPRRFSED